MHVIIDMSTMLILGPLSRRGLEFNPLLRNNSQLSQNTEVPSEDMELELEEPSKPVQ